MHKVKIVGVKTLETPKFDADTAQWENPVKGTVRWGKEVSLASAAIYNGQDVVIMTVDEYNRLVEGKDFAMPEEMRQAMKTAITVMMDILDGKEKGA